MLSLICKEIRKINKNRPYDFLIDIDLTEYDESMPEVTFKIYGPQDSVYKDITYRVKMLFSNDYPEYAPVLYFVNKCFHPNVDKDTGRICFNMIDEDWSSNLNINALIWGVYALLETPNPDSALWGSARRYFERYSYDDDRFVTKVKRKSLQEFSN